MERTQKLTTTYDEETGKGAAELIHGRVETIIDKAAKIAGLAKRNIRIGGGGPGNLDPWTHKRGRILSKRRKFRWT